MKVNVWYGEPNCIVNCINETRTSAVLYLPVPNVLSLIHI